MYCISGPQRRREQASQVRRLSPSQWEKICFFTPLCAVNAPIRSPLFPPAKRFTYWLNVIFMKSKNIFPVSGCFPLVSAVARLAS